jgi:DNA-binding CsgD family transcriptional regulator
MGGDRTSRHRWKEHFHSLERELQSEYGLSPIESRALVRRIDEFIDQVFEDRGGLRSPGQIRYVAVAEGQPAGRPLHECVTVPVLLAALTGSDAQVLIEQGSPALRRARMHRMAREARDQGGLLSYEDLSLILGVDVTTIRRLVARCRSEGFEVPTRGFVSDIGPGVSHRARVIELLFRGMQPAQIAAYTSHSLSSVERYIADFARIAELARQGLDKPVIMRITALSPKTVRDYLALMERYSGAQHRCVMEMLLQRFCPVMPEKEKN